MHIDRHSRAGFLAADWRAGAISGKEGPFGRLLVVPTAAGQSSATGGTSMHIDRHSRAGFLAADWRAGAISGKEGPFGRLLVVPQSANREGPARIMCTRMVHH